MPLRCFYLLYLLCLDNSCVEIKPKDKNHDQKALNADVGRNEANSKEALKGGKSNILECDYCNSNKNIEKEIFTQQGLKEHIEQKHSRGIGDKRKVVRKLPDKVITIANGGLSKDPKKNKDITANDDFNEDSKKNKENIADVDFNKDSKKNSYGISNGDLNKDQRKSKDTLFDGDLNNDPKKNTGSITNGDLKKEPKKNKDTVGNGYLNKDPKKNKDTLANVDLNNNPKKNKDTIANGDLNKDPKKNKNVIGNGDLDNDPKKNEDNIADGDLNKDSKKNKDTVSNDDLNKDPKKNKDTIANDDSNEDLKKNGETKIKKIAGKSVVATAVSDNVQLLEGVRTNFEILRGKLGGQLKLIPGPTFCQMYHVKFGHTLYSLVTKMHFGNIVEFLRLFPDVISLALTKGKSGMHKKSLKDFSVNFLTQKGESILFIIRGIFFYVL